MKDIPRLLPVWLVLLLIILFAMCGCRGGRALGNGSAGTVIIPETPQEINERNRPIFEPLPPVPIIPPQSSPIVTTNEVRSNPVKIEPKSAEADPVVIDPKPAGELKPFSPTIKTTPVKLPPAKVENLPTKIIKKNNENVIIKKNNNEQKKLNENKKLGATPLKQEKPKQSGLIDWWQLIYYWLFILVSLILGWLIYDTVNGFIKERKQRKEEEEVAEKARQKVIKKPAKSKKKKATASKAVTKKTSPKKAKKDISKAVGTKKITNPELKKKLKGKRKNEKPKQ